LLQAPAIGLAYDCRQNHHERLLKRLAPAAK
jgi:hypothetical protein